MVRKISGKWKANYLKYLNIHVCNKNNTTKEDIANISIDSFTRSASSTHSDAYLNILKTRRKSEH